MKEAASNLAEPVKLDIYYDSSCMDCNTYASDLVQTLRKTPGWIVSKGAQIGTMGDAACGLAVFLRDIRSPAPEAVILTRALEAAGIEFETFQGREMVPGLNVHLLVTARADH
jgi:hypothetical protein